MKFTEAQLESAIIELLGAEGYPHVLGETIARTPQEVLIKEDLRAFLAKRYAGDGITAVEIEAVVKKLEAYPAADLYESNKAIMKLVSDGFLLKREDHTKKDLFIQLIDYPLGYQGGQAAPVSPEKFSQKDPSICEKQDYLTGMQSIENKTSARIYGNQRGWAFSKTDFLDLGNDADIRKALSGLAARGTIRRVLRGVYDYPRISKLLDSEMGPDLDQVAQALARKSGWRIQPSENTALNFLGLSTQVPAQSVYLSDGPSKTYEIGNQQLAFKKRTLKESVFKHKESELVVQALKALGQERMDPPTLKKLAAKWTPNMWRKILRDTKTAPAWVCDIIRNIVKEAAS